MFFPIPFAFITNWCLLKVDTYNTYMNYKYANNTDIFFKKTFFIKKNIYLNRSHILHEAQSEITTLYRLNFWLFIQSHCPVLNFSRQIFRHLRNVFTAYIFVLQRWKDEPNRHADKGKKSISNIGRTSKIVTW